MQKSKSYSNIKQIFFLIQIYFILLVAFSGDIDTSNPNIFRPTVFPIKRLCKTLKRVNLNTGKTVSEIISGYDNAKSNFIAF